MEFSVTAVANAFFPLSMSPLQSGLAAEKMEHETLETKTRF